MKRCRPKTLLKEETLAQVFSYEFSEVFKNGFFIEHSIHDAADHVNFLTNVIVCNIYSPPYLQV